jgi:hypothetical protein
MQQDDKNGSQLKLTKWSNEPTVALLKTDLDQAKPFHDIHMKNVKRWNDLSAVRGSAKPTPVKGRSSVQPKLIRKQAEWRYAALTEPFLGTNKLFKVSPVSFEDTKSAEQNELVLNWQFRTKLNKIKFVDDFVRSVVDEGTCIVRTGWKREVVPYKKKVSVFTHYELASEEEAQVFQEALMASQDDPRTFSESASEELKAAIDYYAESGVATTAKITGEELVDAEKVIENCPTVEVMNLNNVHIDSTCQGDLKKALFVVVSFETNKAELLREPKKYKKSQLDRIDWNSASISAQVDHESSISDSSQFTDALRKKIVAYEYWGYYDIDGNGSLQPIVCTWIGDVMIRAERSPFNNGVPFVLVPYSPVKRSLYGEPDAELLEDNQKILGAVSRGMIDLLGRSANGQQGFAKGMLDPLNRRRYDSGQDYEFNPNMPPANGMIEHKFPEIPQSALVMLNLQNQEAESLTGVKSFSGGISGEAYGKVATGIRGALDAASKREMAILRRLAQGMTEIGNKIIAMNSELLSEKEVVRVTNKEFVTVMREDLVGNFDLEVDISTAEVDNAKSEDLAFMLQTIGPNMDSGITMLLLAEIATLKRMPMLAHKLLKYKPEPSPEEIEMQKLALEKARKEIEYLDSQIQLNMAKAGEAKSKADMIDLDYVEQETGTKHERDMQKQRAQSQGNQNLQVTKAMTSPKKEGESDPDLEAAIGFNQISDKLTDGSMVDPQIPAYQ